MRFLTLTILLYCCSYVAHAQTAPNIVFVYTDDQAPWAAGFAGNTQIETPNMDLLAKQGVYLPNAYTTTPVCSPSRAGLLTSRYGYELGIDDWINTIYNSISGKEPNLGLSAKVSNWPSLFQNAGYKTALIGKWHLGDRPQFHPTKLGYDEFHGFISGGTDTINPKLEIDGIVTKKSGLTVDILTNLAIEFIKRNDRTPFMLSLHYRAPHTNWLPVAKEDAKPYQNIDIALPIPGHPDLDRPRAKKMMKEYLSSVTGIDRNLGKLMAAMDKIGLADNTIVIFTSDHGYNMGHNGIWHKGNGHWLLKDKTKAISNIPANQRPNMYDNSLKVPLIVSWPKKIPAGTTNLTTFSNLDWFPTLLSLAGIEIPNNQLMRGSDKSEAFFKPDSILSNDYYAAYTTKHQSKTGMRMYSDGKYKLIQDYVNKGRDEFYDLTIDPSETTNLIDTNKPELQKRIVKFEDIIFDRMLATDDPLALSLYKKTKDETYATRKPDYSQLPLSEFSKTLSSGTRILELENWNVWGASPIIDQEGKYHVFYSRWRGDHGNWLSHSEIAHAVADKAEGPYTSLGAVLKGRGGDKWDADTIHNPTIQKVGDKYALFFIGNNLKLAKNYDGHHASTQRIGLALSDSLYGPFIRVSEEPILDVSNDKKQWDSYLTTNPALLQHPNGEFWLYYKAWDKYNDSLRKMGVAFSDNIKGPYKKYTQNPIVNFDYLGKQVEDAYVFINNNKFHMLMRDMGVFHPHVGLLLTSESGLEWGKPELGYKTNMAYTKENKIRRFERPQVLMTDGKPSHVFLALMGGKAKTSSGFVIPIDN